MFKKSLTIIALAATLAGCGSDNDAELDGNNRGSIDIIGTDFVAGGELRAALSDADGVREDTVTYAWSTGATGISYTITEADEGSVISVSARYTDQSGFTEA